MIKYKVISSGFATFHTDLFLAETSYNRSLEASLYEFSTNKLLKEKTFYIKTSENSQVDINEMQKLKIKKLFNTEVIIYTEEMHNKALKESDEITSKYKKQLENQLLREEELKKLKA